MSIQKKALLSMLLEATRSGHQPASVLKVPEPCYLRPLSLKTFLCKDLGAVATPGVGGLLGGPGYNWLHDCCDKPVIREINKLTQDILGS